MIYYQGTGFSPKTCPKRIVSLVPSQTELLYFLGIEPVAQTLFCVHPASQFKKAKKIGGTKNLKIKKILDLAPDLVIGNKEENEKKQIEALSQSVPVWLSDIYTLEDSFQMIEEIGRITQRFPAAKELANQLRSGFEQLKTNKPKKSCVYIIWKDPYMVAAKDTFIDSILHSLGYSNLLANETRYPELSVHQLQNLEPDYVLLSSEPYPFKQKHLAELQTILPRANIQLVDGELFSWYGPRLLKTLQFAKENA